MYCHVVRYHATTFLDPVSSFVSENVNQKVPFGKKIIGLQKVARRDRVFFKHSDFIFGLMRCMSYEPVHTPWPFDAVEVPTSRPTMHCVPGNDGFSEDSVPPINGLKA